MTDPNQPTPPNDGQQNPYAGAAADPLKPADDVLWGSIAHLGGIIGFLPSLIIWLILKDRGPFTNTEAKEALNFQITIAIVYAIGLVLTVILIGGLICLAAGVISIIFSVLGFLKAKQGEHYRYPFALRLIK